MPPIVSGPTSPAWACIRAKCSTVWRPPIPRRASVSATGRTGTSSARREALPPNCRRCLLLDGFPPRADVYHGLNQRLPTRVRHPAVATFHDLFVLTGDYSTPEFRRRFAQQAKRRGGARGPHRYRLRIHRAAGGRTAWRPARAAARDPPWGAAGGTRADRARKGGAARGRDSAAQERGAVGRGLRSPGAGLAAGAGGFGRLRRRSDSAPASKTAPRASASR